MKVKQKNLVKEQHTDSIIIVMSEVTKNYLNDMNETDKEAIDILNDIYKN